MDDALVAEAKNYLSDVDHIVDLYDLSIVWLGPKWTELTQYTQEDVDGKKRP